MPEGSNGGFLNGQSTAALEPLLMFLNGMPQTSSAPIVTRYIPPNYGSAGDWEARIEDGPFEINGYGGTEQEAIADCKHQWVEHCEEEELFKRRV